MENINKSINRLFQKTNKFQQTLATLIKRKERKYKLSLLEMKEE